MSKEHRRTANARRKKTYIPITQKTDKVPKDVTQFINEQLKLLGAVPTQFGPEIHLDSDGTYRQDLLDK